MTKQTTITTVSTGPPEIGSVDTFRFIPSISGKYPGYIQDLQYYLWKAKAKQGEQKYPTPELTHSIQVRQTRLTKAIQDYEIRALLTKRVGKDL